jgi:hypothetical protein
MGFAIPTENPTRRHLRIENRQHCPEICPSYRYLFEHAGQHPINRIRELLPWNLAPKLAKLPPDG